MIDIQAIVSKVLQANYGITKDITESMFSDGILDEYVCKKFIIREEWNQKAGFVSRTDLKIQLADKYCVSVSTVEKYVAN